MFLIDDILLFPARGVLHIFREIHDMAQQEAANEAEAVRMELAELYMMLETEKIPVEEFEKRESQLLDHLEQVESRMAAAASASEER